MNQKAFTLIELLVVVAIIGILAAVGVVAYNGYTASAKRNATLGNFKTLSKLIHNTFQLCETQNEVQLSPRRIVNCNVANTPSGIGQAANVFLNYVKESGFKNPYDNNAEIIKYTGSGGDTVDGRNISHVLNVRKSHEKDPPDPPIQSWVNDFAEVQNGKNLSHV